MKRKGLVFELRGNTVYASFSHMGEKFKVATRFIINNKNEFDNNIGVFTSKFPDYLIGNDYLKDYRYKIQTLINEADIKERNRVLYVKEELERDKRNKLNSIKQLNINSEFYKACQEYLKVDTVYTSSTNRKTKHEYEGVLKCIRDYEINKGTKIYLSDLDRNFITSFFHFHRQPYIQYCGNYDVHNKDLLRPRNFKGYSATTLSKKLAYFKKALEYMSKRLKIEIDDTVLDFKYSRGDTHLVPVVLELTELKALNDFNPQTDDEKLVIDFILCSLATGLNYSDMLDLRASYFGIGTEYFHVTINRNKSRVRCSIPLTPYIYNIFKSYNFQFKEISNYWFNKNFKEIMIKLPEFDKIDEKTSEEMGYDVPQTRSDLITHGVFRKSMVTFAREVGVAEIDIRERVGHNDGRMMRYYLRIQRRAIKPEYKKIIEKIIYVPAKY